MTLPFIATLPAVNQGSSFDYTITDERETTGTFNASVNIGAPASNRMIFVVFGSIHAYDVTTTMSLDGSNMNVTNRSFYNPHTSIGRIAITTGTTATLILTPTTAAQTVRGRLVVIAIYGVTNTLVQSKNSASGSNIMSLVVNCQDDGVLLVATTCEYNNPITFSGVTSIYAYLNMPPYAGNVGRLDIGIYIPTSQQTNRPVSLTQSRAGGGQDKTMIAYSVI
jgi:hypothetical protein